MSLVRSTLHHKLPKNMKHVKKGSGINRFTKASDTNRKENRKCIAICVLITLLLLMTHLTNSEMNGISFLVMKMEIENHID